MLVFLTAVAVAGAPPDGEIDIDKLFDPKGKKEEKVTPSVCVVCGQPLWKHAEPGFVCEDPTKRAVRVRHREVTCPVCRRDFAAPLRTGVTRSGGTDSDLCVHPIGTAAVTSRIWICVGCGYAALHEDFEEAVGAEVKKFVRKHLSEATESRLREMVSFETFRDLPLDFLKPEDVPDTLEHENALRVYAFRKAPEDVLARLHLEASYACRREFCAPLMCERVFPAIRKMDRLLVDPENLDAPLSQSISRARSIAEEQAGRLRPDELCYLSLRLAGCYARLGEGWNAREELLNALSWATKEGDRAKAKELKEIVRDRFLLLAREAQHQSMACEYMTEAVRKGAFERQGLVRAAYLIGELHKRLGKLKEAVAWFRAESALVSERYKEKARPLSFEKDVERVLAEVEQGKRLHEGLALLAEKALSSPLLRGVEPEAETVAAPLKLLGLDEEVERALAEIEERRREKEAEAAAEAAEVADPAEPAKVESERAALSCKEILKRIYRAAAEYEKTRGKIPSNFEELTNAGLLAREEMNGFVCPESGVPLFYRKPKQLAGDGFMVYHKNPMDCACRLILRADGTVGRVDE